MGSSPARSASLFAVKKFNSFVWLILTCAVLMLAVPFGLRVLLDRVAPREDEKSLTAAEKLQTILGDARPSAASAGELLKKPLDAWTKDEAAAEPALAGWLKARAKRIFPWDWSEAQRAKNAEGYRQVWADLFEELGDGCRSAIKTETKALARTREELEVRTAFIGRLTNRIVRLEADLATNGAPTTVTDETVRRGWLWGFSSKEKTRSVVDAGELRQVVESESQKIAHERLAVAALAKEAARAEAELRELDTLQTAMAHVGEDEADRLAVVVRVVRRQFRPASESVEKK